MQKNGSEYIDNARQAANDLIEKVFELVEKGELREEFEVFYSILKNSVSPSINKKQAVEMLVQHMIIRPIFDCLYKEYRFARNNGVSKYMQHIVEMIESELNQHSGYDCLKQHIADTFSPKNGNFDENDDHHYGILKDIFSTGNTHYKPQSVNPLPMLRDVKNILVRKFNTDLNSSDVQIVNPIAGTGAVITHLFDEEFINKENALRKFKNEIFCSSPNLLDYYISDLNIENAFHKYMSQLPYMFFNGIKLYDPFFDSLGGFDFINDESSNFNSETIKVVVGALPEKLEDMSGRYPRLERRIKETFGDTPINNISLLMRWAADILVNCQNGGVMSFVGDTAIFSLPKYSDMMNVLAKELSSKIQITGVVTFWK